MKKGEFSIEIDMMELVVLLQEAAVGKPRERGKTAKELFEMMSEDRSQLWLRVGYAAGDYFLECLKKGQTPS